MAFVLTWFIIPSVVSISRLKNLCSKPNIRTSHINDTPNLGGIAVFIGLVLSTVICAGTYFVYELKYLISGLIIVFFVGIKDDILIIAPLKKLAGQIFAVALIAVFADIRINDLYGLFGINQIPYIPSILLTIFVFIVIINGFNLIDGIDGLASGIGILTSSVFGVWFYRTGHIACAILSFSFVGALASFFWFNVFSKKNKIFLGDTGSMLTGFVIGILACRMLRFDLSAPGTAYFESAPAVVFGVLVIPLFDSLRVFFLRVKQGRSPFKADRQHLHHRLLETGRTHLQATLIMISVNVFFIILSFALQNIGIIWLMIVMLGLASLMSHVLVLQARKKKKAEISAIIAGYFAMKTTKNRINIKERVVAFPSGNLVFNMSGKANVN
jgi:UDP-GlcNAc:undecaprenyl-phosphate/decaprenyl-phosphate GlcNAc-1-phosphate transferase